MTTKNKDILIIEKLPDEDNKQKYCLMLDGKCIAYGRAEHETIIKMFQSNYNVIVRYVNKIISEN